MNRWRALYLVFERASVTNCRMVMHPVFDGAPAKNQPMIENPVLLNDGPLSWTAPTQTRPPQTVAISKCTTDLRICILDKLFVVSLNAVGYPLVFAADPFSVSQDP